jgi:hypothetical protein
VRAAGFDELHDGDSIRIVGYEGSDLIVRVDGEPDIDDETGAVTVVVRSCAHPKAVFACNLWQCPDCGQRADIVEGQAP